MKHVLYSYSTVHAFESYIGVTICIPLVYTQILVFKRNMLRVIRVTIDTLSKFG